MILTSLALIFLCGLLLGGLMKKLGLPDLLGMLITGIILGPYALNLLAPSILQLSADLRQIALVIILLRAGLSLDLEALKKVGRPALLMCFIPATLELLGTLIIAPTLLGISLLDAAILGTVLAAVSPAVIVPRMVNLIEEQRGTHHSIPQLIMAGASVDDIFVIVLFTSFTGIAEGGQFSIESFLGIPLAILLGIVVGLVVGLLLTKCFKSMHLRDSIKVIIILSIAFLLVSLESTIKATIPFSGLIAIMTLGATLYRNYCPLASRLSNKFSKLWIAAQLILFVLVGATVDLSYALKSTIPALLVISFALVFRALGVWLALLKTPLTKQERIFCIVAYMPKATVQAAIGSIPLTMGLSCGPIVLTISVIAIVLTAPLGAFGIDYLSHRLLPIE